MQPTGYLNDKESHSRVTPEILKLKSIGTQQSDCNKTSLVVTEYRYVFLHQKGSGSKSIYSQLGVICLFECTNVHTQTHFVRRNCFLSREMKPLMSWGE